jgi:sugar (pentulose or hexulose) kinase
MGLPELRGTAVIDAGATNTKIVLFSPAGEVVAERRAATRHVEGPPYRHIDPEVLAGLCRTALPELDGILPIDCVVPAAHGAALACLSREGGLALPVMDYTAEPPEEIVAAYRKIEPPFSEVFGPLLPMALTHGLQLYWQQRAFAEDFARIATIIPWIQYVGFRLSGAAVTEISSMSCQSQLMDVRAGKPSSLARRQGWDLLFPRMAKAWETIGTLLPEFRGTSFRGQGRVVAGVHDSNGNYLRYLAAGLGAFTLVSSGTWIISFDTETTVDALDPARDTNTNTDVFGRQVACSRFFGGREFEIVARDAPADAASLAAAARLVGQGTLALPSFSNSGGPMPGTGDKGRISGPFPQSTEEFASLAALYCALMCDQQLDAVGSRSRIVVDGPFAQNGVFLALLAALRPEQDVLASNLRDGTTAGAALLARIGPDGRLPQVGLDLKRIVPAPTAGLADYAARWLKESGGDF